MRKQYITLCIPGVINSTNSFLYPPYAVSCVFFCLFCNKSPTTSFHNKNSNLNISPTTHFHNTKGDLNTKIRYFWKYTLIVGGGSRSVTWDLPLSIGSSSLLMYYCTIVLMYYCTIVLLYFCTWGAGFLSSSPNVTIQQHCISSRLNNV